MTLSTKLFLLVLPLFASCAALPSPALAPQFYSQYECKLLASASSRSSDNAFDPVDDQTAYGLELEVHQPKGNTGFEIGFFYSVEEQTNDVPGVGPVKFKGDSYEFSLGGRLYFEPIFLGCRPYFGGGATSQYLEYTNDPDNGEKDKDSVWAAFAPYFRAGAEWALGEHLSVGVDYRVVVLSNLFHHVDLGDRDADGDYYQFGLVVGWTF